MSTLSSELRNKLERTCIAARNLAERAAADALKSLAVAHHEPYGHMTVEQRTLRNKLRARGRQLGDTQDGKGQLSIHHLAQECAYEQWHRMLFARFLAENNLLIEPDMGVAVSLDEVKELAKDAKTNLWTLAGRYAQTMLPEIFRADDPVLQVPLAREDQIKLEELLDALAKETFTASDSLGWCYQFWQAEKKETVNKSGNKIGADELPSVTQLFTEDYMVDFLLDNTLGAWWAGKKLTAENAKHAEFKTEEDVRRFCALPGCPWKYLRFVKVGDTSPRPSPQSGEGEASAASRNSGRASTSPSAANVSPSPPSEGGEGRGEVGLAKTKNNQSLLTSAATGNSWQPAAGRFDGWPKTAKELRALDPCCGSGHFIVAMFQRLVALRMAEEKLDEKAAVAAVIRDNLFGLELDPRCTQIGAFNLALAAWRRVGHCALPAMHIACSGLAPNAREADWLKIVEAASSRRGERQDASATISRSYAEDERLEAAATMKLQRGMARLYRLFQNAPVLGSLINPHAGGGDLLEAGFQELRPLLAKALEVEEASSLSKKNQDQSLEGSATLHEMAVTAQGITKAAEILAGQFTLVATNVPYLARGKQCAILQEYSESFAPNGKMDLATVFLQRCREFLGRHGVFAVVSPQNWLFLSGYTEMRGDYLRTMSWLGVGRLGPGAFETISGEIVNTSLLILDRESPPKGNAFLALDASANKTCSEKSRTLQDGDVQMIQQADQIKNPDFRIVLAELAEGTPLRQLASALSGCSAGDGPRFIRLFWEVPRNLTDWEFHQSTVPDTCDYGGKAEIIFWEQERGEMFRLADSVKHLNHAAQNWLRGKPNWKKKGVLISQMGDLPPTIYLGDIYDCNCCAIVPNNPEHLPALWAFCVSGNFTTEVRKINQKLNVTPGTLLDVPFDLAHWQKVAAEKYPHGLPKPFSSDPTQWLFNGHPKVAEPSRLLSSELQRQDASATVAEPSRLFPSSALRLEAAATFPPVNYFQPDEPVAHLTGDLPHWRQPGTTYFVTFRCADALPQEKLQQWQQELSVWHAAHPEPHAEATRREFYEHFPNRIQTWLDAGHGECALREPAMREIVESALRHFDGQRYRLQEFVVAANHVHALVTPLGEHRLSDILHSWKSFTANKINEARDKSGAFWQKESFDHIVRSPASLAKFREYILAHQVQRLEASATVAEPSRLCSPEQKRQAASATLQVAVARLLGYQWPRQTGSSFPDCPALGPDGLEKLADDDGIVCLPSVRGESPAAERLRKLLSVAYGKDWKSTTELELIRATGSEAGDLEEWLRDDFFDQHCDLFHQRPFVWHIWDGRKRDGFHALVNYHTLASGDQGRRTLESLTHSYLGDWITRQKDGMKREEEGADERLAAALALKEKLEAILVGEGDPARGTGFDIFVRWKPLSQQAIGWQPDINDGVRMNIRPFLASDIAGGKKGAGVLRIKPNIKWDKDRGKEPKRDKKDFPWFWNGSTFTGDRVNDVHLTRKQKEEGASRTGK